MAISPDNVTLPQPGIAFVGPDGNISREWYYFLLGLLNRTGGSTPIPPSNLQEQIIALFNESAMQDVQFPASPPVLAAFLADMMAPDVQPAVNWSVPALMGFMGSDDTAGLASIGAAQSYRRAQQGAIVPLTYAATVTPDFSAGNNFDLTLTGNVTFANPDNVTAGQGGQIAVHQDGTGGRTWAFGGNWFPVGGVAPVASVAANTIDIVTYYTVSTTHITYSALLNA